MCIPKIIHYIWFGDNPLGEKELACIESWKKYLPDYEIKCWDESNFDVSQSEYCLQAYRAKKWAFVSDYVRLWALVNYGGIYMDTDVEVIRPLDEFLKLEAFSGFESPRLVPTGIMASKKGHPFFIKLLNDYRERSFIKNDGSYDMTTNVTAITNACIEAGLQPNNTRQTINGFTLFPKDFFCPKNNMTGKIELTDNTYTIHHFSGSWVDEPLRIVAEKKRKILSKNPKMNLNAAGLLAYLSYSISTRDFKPLINSVKKHLSNAD